MLRWLLIILCVLSIRAQAQTASSFTYGGRLANADGSPRTGAVTLTFEIANSIAPGTVLCSKSIPTTTDANGVFNVTVDYTLAECGGVNTFAQHLQNIIVGGNMPLIQVDDGTTTYPQQVITSSPIATYAVNASAIIPDNSIAPIKLDGSPTTCPAGDFLTIDGSLNFVCMTPAGAITSVSAGNGLANSGTAGAPILDVNVDGTTLTIAADTLSVGTIGSANITNGSIVAADIDNTSVQQRVTGTCAAGTSIATINANGTVTCETDDSGTVISGGTNNTITKFNVTGTNVVNSIMVENGTDIDVAGSVDVNAAGSYKKGNTTILNTAPNSGLLVGNAGSAGLTGFSAIFIGDNAGQNTTSGSFNVFVGVLSGNANITGGTNTYIGNSAGRTNTSGSDNTMIGSDAGRLQIAGGENTYLGSDAGENMGTGSGNVYLGYRAGSHASASAFSNRFVLDNKASDFTTTYPLIGGDFTSGRVHISEVCDETGANCKDISSGWGGGGDVTDVNATANQGILVGSPTGPAPSVGLIDCAANEILKRNAGDTAWVCAADAGGGVTTLNTQTGATQTLAVDSLGVNPAWTSAANIHTLSIPMASTATASAGLISYTTYLDFLDAANKFDGSSTMTSGKFCQYDGTRIVCNYDEAGLGDLTAVTVTANQGLQVTNSTGPVPDVALIDCAANQVLQRNIGDTAWVCANASAMGLFTDVTPGTDNIKGGAGSGALIAAGANRNFLAGVSAGAALSTGDDNILIGNEAGLNLATTSQNVFIGRRAGRDQTGTSNVMIGNIAGEQATSGSNNVVMGESAGRYITGSDNTLLGTSAGGSVGNTANNNTFVGRNAGYSNTTGYSNTILGHYAGLNNTTGFGNIFIGADAGHYQTNGNDRLYIDNRDRANAANEDANALIVGTFGAAATNQELQVNAALRPIVTSGATPASMAGAGDEGFFWYDTTANKFRYWDGAAAQDFAAAGGSSFFTDVTAGTDNIKGGANAGAALAVGGNNNFLAGKNAGDLITTGDENVIIGNEAGTNGVTSTANTMIGYLAGEESEGDANVYIGRGSGPQSAGVNTDADNVAIGNDAGRALTTGYSNTLVGRSSGRSITTGYSNSSFGRSAGYSLVDGDFNVNFGSSAGYTNASGNNNVFVGQGSGYYTTGSDNVFLGSDSGNGVTGAGNIMIGRHAGNFAGANGYNNRLLITNSTDTTPLIDGDFGTNTLRVNGTFEICSATGTGCAAPGTGGGDITDVNATANQGILVGSSTGPAPSVGLIDCAANEVLQRNPGDTAWVCAALSGLAGDHAVVNGSVFGGTGAGSNDDGANQNVGFGRNALNANVSGSGNSAFGHAALSLTTGLSNTAVGVASLGITTSGNFNTAVGNATLQSNVTGSSNTVIGDRAGYATTGSNNVFLGSFAGRWQAAVSDKLIIDDRDRASSGNENSNALIVGTFGAAATNQSLQVNGVLRPIVTSGATPTSASTMGEGAFWYDTTANKFRYWDGAAAADFAAAGGSSVTIPTANYFPVSNGTGTDFATSVMNQSGTSVGINTLAPNDALDVTGDIDFTGTIKKGGNIFVDSNSANANTRVGVFAGSTSNGSNHTFVGAQAGSSNNAAATNNTYVGSEAGQNNNSATSTNNSFFGFRAGKGNTGNNNVFIGSEAGSASTTTNLSIYVGPFVGTNSAADTKNIFLGTSTGFNYDGSHSILLGDMTASNLIGSYNIIMGTQTAERIDSGSSNVIIGHGAALGQIAVTGLNNSVILGREALYSIQASSNNVALGHQAGYSGLFGAGNVFLGYQAGYSEMGSNKLYISNSNTTTPLIYGDFSTNRVRMHEICDEAGANCKDISTGWGGASLFTETANNSIYGGTGAGASLTTGPGNFIAGLNAGDALTTTGNNIIIGSSAGGATTGSNSVLIGVSAGEALTTSSGTFLGAFAGRYLTGSGNTAIGVSAGIGVSGSSGGANNTYVGNGAGIAVTSAGNNVFLGASAGGANTSGSGNVYVGSSVGSTTTTSNNVMIGYQSGDTGSTASSAVHVGYRTGRASTGVGNTLVGNSAGEGLTSGSSNTFLGSSAGGAMTTGTQNTFLGYAAGQSASTSYSTIIGPFAGEIVSGTNNLIMGSYTGRYVTSGANNIFLGTNAGRGVAAGTPNTGSSNIAIGTQSGEDLGAGSSNTFVGYISGSNMTSGTGNAFFGHSSGIANLTGNSNTFLGAGAGITNTGSSNVFIGADAGGAETGSSKLYIENSNTATPLIGGDFSANRVGINTAIGSIAYTLDVGGDVRGTSFIWSSDARLKNNVETLENASEKVNALRGVEFIWKESGESDIGFIAQEVEKVEPLLVSSKGEFKAVKYANITALLVEAFKEMGADIEELQKNQKSFEFMQKGIEQNARDIASIKEENKKLKSEVEDLKVRLERLEKLLVK